MANKQPDQISEEVSSVDEPVPTWINCAATLNCPGKQAKKVITFNQIGTGRTYRYVCLTCKRPFHIQVGAGLR